MQEKIFYVSNICDSFIDVSKNVSLRDTNGVQAMSASIGAFEKLETPNISVHNVVCLSTW